MAGAVGTLTLKLEEQAWDHVERRKAMHSLMGATLTFLCELGLAGEPAPDPTLWRCR
jgi:hypothetical protein